MKILFYYLIISVIIFIFITHPKIVGAQSTCMTKEQVNTNSNCLYILNNNVYKKGSKTNPHKGHPCGMDVSSIIPGFHLSDIARYIDPNFFSSLCSSTQPTQTPVPSNTSTPTPFVPTPTFSTTPQSTATPIHTLTPDPLEPTLTPCAKVSQGDSTCDLTIDLVDYVCWLGLYQQVLITGLSQCKTADFDNNGIMNTDDFFIWMNSYISITI